jgi:phosphatidate cytidylyltransferase
VSRVLSGAVLGGIVLAIVWFAPPEASLGLSAIFLVLAAKEVVDMARISGLKVSAWVPATGALTTLAAIGAPAFASDSGSVLLSIVLMAQIVAILGAAIAAWEPGARDALAAASVALFPSIYIGVPLGALVAIRAVEGPATLLLLVLTVAVSDTAQYYTGRLTGRRPLAPSISPKKTIEGALGGIVFGTLLFAIVGAWWLARVPLALRVVVGLAIVLAGISGDLFESMLKRSAGVKDSSSIIPGHGGVLDRIDALLFAAPVYYIVLQYV